MKKKTCKPLSNMELSSFCSQMAMILKAGISSMEGITIMLEDAVSEEEKKILRLIQEKLAETGIVKDALESSGVFPVYLLQMAQIGEQTGRLDDVMESLARHYEREESLSSSIRSAVTYPLIMISMMLIIVLILVVKVLPIFQQIFQQFGFEMNTLSTSLMHAGLAISRYSTVIIMLLVVLVLGAFLLTRTKKGGGLFIGWLSHMRFTRDYYHKMAACRFASGLSLSLKSGLTPEQGIQLAQELTGNPAFLESLEVCKQEMENGKTLSDVFMDAHIFPGLYARMITVGDRTGTLDDVLQKIAVRYEEELDTRLSDMIGKLEPTLVVILSIVVGLILLSVMLPLMGILSSL